MLWQASTTRVRSTRSADFRSLRTQSRVMSLICLPRMPPSAFSLSAARVAPFSRPSPQAAVGPLRASMIPIRISLDPPAPGEQDQAHEDGEQCQRTQTFPGAFSFCFPIVRSGADVLDRRSAAWPTNSDCNGTIDFPILAPLSFPRCSCVWPGPAHVRRLPHRREGLTVKRSVTRRPAGG